MNHVLPVSAALAAALGLAAPGALSFACLGLAIVLALAAIGRNFFEIATLDPWRDLRKANQRARKRAAEDRARRAQRSAERSA